MCGEGECPRPSLRRGGSICYSSLAGRKEGSAFRQVGFSTITWSSSSSSSSHQRLRDKPSCCLGGDLVMVV